LGSLLVEEAQWEEAEATLEQAMEFYQAIQSQQGMAHVLSALTTIAQTRGELDTAESLATRSLELCQHLGFKSLETVMWTRLGLIALEQQHDNEALQKLKRGLELGPSVDTVTFANVLLALSAWGANHDPHWAAQLFSLAEQLENTTGKHFPNHSQSLYVLTKEQLIKSLGERGFKTALQLGASRKLEEVLDHLLAIPKYLPKRQQQPAKASSQTS
jgi:tetratricopeptide (TPR) repeat protein